MAAPSRLRFTGHEPSSSPMPSCPPTGATPPPIWRAPSGSQRQTRSRHWRRALSSPQRGCVADRHIVDEIAGLDGIMVALLLRVGCRADAVLFDFANVVLALGRAWMFVVSRHMATPVRLVNVITALYRDLTTTCATRAFSSPLSIVSPASTTGVPVVGHDVCVASRPLRVFVFGPPGLPAHPPLLALGRPRRCYGRLVPHAASRRARPLPLVARLGCPTEAQQMPSLPPLGRRHGRVESSPQLVARLRRGCVAHLCALLGRRSRPLRGRYALGRQGSPAARSPCGTPAHRRQRALLHNARVIGMVGYRAAFRAAHSSCSTRLGAPSHSRHFSHSSRPASARTSSTSASHARQFGFAALTSAAVRAAWDLYDAALSCYDVAILALRWRRFRPYLAPATWGASRHKLQIFRIFFLITRVVVEPNLFCECPHHCRYRRIRP